MRWPVNLRSVASDNKSVSTRQINDPNHSHCIITCYYTLRRPTYSSRWQPSAVDMSGGGKSYLWLAAVGGGKGQHLTLSQCRLTLLNAIPHAPAPPLMHTRTQGGKRASASGWTHNWHCAKESILKKKHKKLVQHSNTNLTTVSLVLFW